MNLSELHLIRPYWLLALLPAMMLLVVLWRRRSTASGWDALIAPDLLRTLIMGRNDRLGRLPLFLLGGAWLLAIGALAGPTWERQPQPVYRASLDQVVVLDMSQSMTKTDITPDRLTRARFAINDLMAQTREGRTALIVFGGEHHVVTPLTDDTATVELLLAALSVDVLPVPGDRAASALGASLQLLAAAKSKTPQVILISDGINDPAQSILTAVQLREAGAELSVIGIGTDHEAQLRELARSGGGVYQTLGARGPQPALIRQAGTDFTQQPDRELKVDLWVENGAWLLLPLLLVAAAGYRRGWLVLVVIIAAYQQPQDAMAFEWKDLWLTPDQQAQRLLDAGQTKQAAELFQNPNWRATARYRNGEFDQAAEEFSDPTAAYNRANALAKAGKLDAALNSYDQALSAHPDDTDARFNRDLVQKILQQKQKQKQNEKNSGTEKSKQAGSAAEKQPADSDGESDPSQGQGSKGSSQSAEYPESGDSNKGKKGESDPGKEPGTQGSTQSAEHQQPDNSNKGKDNEVNAQAANDASTPPEPGKDPQADLQQQVKSDVAPQTPAQSPRTGGTPGGKAPDNVDYGRPTEEQLAADQWLRQIPDDPAGLLRRKFMLEHLRRIKKAGNQ